MSQFAICKKIYLSLWFPPFELQNFSLNLLPVSHNIDKPSWTIDVVDHSPSSNPLTLYSTPLSPLNQSHAVTSKISFQRLPTWI
jgi:hypothetical protein